MAFISNQQTNPNDPNQQQGPSAQPSATGMASPAPQAQGGMGMPTGQPQPKGSGRFTNIQKYLQANVGAGQRLAGGIGRKVEAQIDPQKQKAESQTSQIAEQVGKAQGRIGEGQRLQEQVGKQDFDVVGFAAQQPNVEEFTKFRTGQAVDEAALLNQAQQAQMQAMQAQQAAQGFTQQLGTEGGRAELLKQTFSPTRSYSMGQQRLDNLLLQQGTPQLQALRSDLLGTSQRLGTLLNENEIRQKNITDLTTQEQDLSKQLAGAIESKDKALEAQLKQRIIDVNTARDIERGKYTAFAEDLLKSGRGEALDKDLDATLLGQTGLQLGEQTFNVLRDPTLEARQLLNISGEDARTIQDVARQEDVARYQALAALGGLNPQKIEKEGKLEAAAGFKTGEGSLRSRIDAAREAFLENAIKQNLVGTGEQGWKSKDFLRGRRGTETASATLNLANVLGGDYAAEMASKGKSQARDMVGQSAQIGIGNPIDNLGGYLGTNALIGSAFGIPGVGILGGATAIANALPGVFGNPNAGKQERARIEAQRIANQNVMNQLNAYLQQQGFNQYLTGRGVQTGTTNLEDYGYGQAGADAQRGRFRNLRNFDIK